MPPAGVVGNMDDEAAIQAEIEFELNNLDLDAEQAEELDDNIDAVDDLSQNPYELVRINCLIRPLDRSAKLHATKTNFVGYSKNRLNEKW